MTPAAESASEEPTLTSPGIDRADADGPTELPGVPALMFGGLPRAESRTPAIPRRRDDISDDGVECGVVMS